MNRLHSGIRFRRARNEGMEPGSLRRRAFAPRHPIEPSARALKVGGTLCITLSESVARRHFQLDSERAASSLDDLRRRLASVGSSPGGHLYQPSRVLQPSGPGRSRRHRLGGSAPATTAETGCRSHPRAVLAQCAGTDLCGGRPFRRPAAPVTARIADCRSGGRNLLRDHRDYRAARPAQAAAVASAHLTLEFHCHGGFDHCRLAVHPIGFEAPPTKRVHGSAGQHFRAIQGMHA